MLFMDLVSDLMISGQTNDCFIAVQVMTLSFTSFLMISTIRMPEFIFGQLISFRAAVEHWDFTNKIRHRISSLKLYFLKLSSFIYLIWRADNSRKSFYQTNVCMCCRGDIQDIPYMGNMIKY